MADRVSMDGYHAVGAGTIMNHGRCVFIRAFSCKLADIREQMPVSQNIHVGCVFQLCRGIPAVAVVASENY